MARITGSYLQQRRSGQWLVQIAVPKDLKARGLPISKYGKPLRKIEHYLHTRDEKEAEDRKHAEIAKIKEMFARLRAGMVITDVEVRRIATAEEWRVYNLLEENHADYPFGFEELARKTGHDLLFSASDDGIVNPLLPGKVTTTEFVTDLLRKHQYVVDAESIDRVEDALLRAQQSAIARISKGMRPPPAPDKHQMKSTPFSEHAKQYLAHPDTRLADVTAQQCRGTYRLFKDHIADAPLASVNRRTVAEFKDRLAQLHKDYGRHPDSAKLTLQQLLERYPAGERPLSAKTVNRHLSALSALWVWAQREGHFVDDAANPCVNQYRKVD